MKAGAGKDIERMFIGYLLLSKASCDFGLFRNGVYVNVTMI